MRKKTIWITIGIVGLLLLTIYAYLGGFRPVKVTTVEKSNYQLIGSYYEGEYDSDTLESLFFQAKELIQEGTVPGTLTIVNYSSKAESDTVSVFVGVLLGNEEMAEIPKGLKKRAITGGKIIRASIHADHLVMPSRTKVDQKLNEFARKNNFSLRPLVIEQYIAEDSLQIDRIVQ